MGPLLGVPVTVTAIPVGNQHGPPISMDMNRTMQAEVATIEDFMLESQHGLMIRERSFLMQILCGACEKQTQFKVANFDPLNTPMPDPEDQHFTNKPASFQVRERSECCQRYCCHQF